MNNVSYRLKTCVVADPQAGDVKQVVLGNALPSSILVQAREVRLIELRPRQVNAWLDWADNAVSCVGHQDTANIVSRMLDREVPYNRISLPADFINFKNRSRASWKKDKLEYGSGNTFITALYEGPRLPEASTTLPEGATLKFYLVAPILLIQGSWPVLPDLQQEIY